MKRIRSILILTTCLLCAIFLFSACSETPSIVFNSVLSINTDESGSRTITASASKETIQSILGKKNNSFQSFIDAYCPETIDWDYVETEDTYELTFVISFQTLDQYQNAVGDLTGNPAGVTISRPQVGITTGFTLTESTKVTDLFSWLLSALSERSGISQAKLSNKLKNGSNELVYAGREYPQKETGLHVYVETLHDAEYIDILTEFSLDGILKRAVNIHFPGDMLHNASNVKPYLSSLLPEGISETWISDRIWSLTFEDGDFKKIGTLMDGLFQSQTDERLTESISADNAMRFTHQYKEPLNLAFFVPNTGSTIIRYYVKTPNAALFIADGNGGLTAADSLNNDYAGYVCLFNHSMSNGTLDFTASYQYQPLEIVVNTQIENVKKIHRTTTLEMGTVLPEIHRTLMIETLTRDSESYGTIKEETIDDMYRILYSQSGTADHINKGFSSVFNGAAAFSYQRPSLKPFDSRLKASFSDRVDFTAFLAAPTQTLITYYLNFPDQEILTDGSPSIISLTTEGLCQLGADTTRPNQLRPWLIALLVILALILTFLILIGPVRYALIRNKKNKRKRGSKKAPARKKGSSTKRSTSSSSGQKKRPQPKSTATKKKTSSTSHKTKTTSRSTKK